MKTRFIKQLLASLVALLVSLPSWSADGDTFYANTEEGVSMRFKVISESEKTCQVGDYENTGLNAISRDYEGRITIPSSVNGYTLTCISYNAFSDCSKLTAVTIPSSVTSIVDYAFRGCLALTSINIPEGVKSIGQEAFRRCSSLTSIRIPSSVKNFGNYAFQGCSSLTSLTITEGIKSIGPGAFADCSSLTSVNIPYGVTSIENSAFSNCTSLESATIPSTVTYFGERVFSGCSNLSTISLPSVYYNKPDYNTKFMFEGCTSLPVINNVRYADTWAIEFVDKTQMTCTVKEGTTYLYESLFQDCTELMRVTLPSSLTAIGRYVFGGCNGLVSCSIPQSVDRIGYAAFNGCSALSTITIPNEVTVIEGALFLDCSGLTSITIPAGVTSIGSQAFTGCSSLTSITIPSSVTSIGYYAFSGCSSLTSINIPSSVTSIESSTFQNCSSLTSITIPESVTSIGESAFSDCFGLTSITIPESVTSIGSSAFRGCSGLTSITIPERVTSMGGSAFDGCYGLTSIAINCGNISTIGLFRGLSNLQEVTIGDNMSVLYNETFSGCSNLEKVTIGTGMEFIRTDAFKGCTSINTIECNAEVPPYCYPNVFADIDVAHCKLYVPEESVDAYANDEQWGAFDIVGLSFPSSIDLTDGETFEGYNRFLDMEQITYSRTFKNTNWQAWYVPFEVELTSDLLSRFSFAKYAGTYVDENSDPSFFITIARLKAGDKLKANTPYFVQAKTASNTAQVISVANTTLKPAQETGFDMYSAEQKVSIRGVYSAKTATAGDCDWYAYGGGSYFKATAGAVLNPYRVYLTITERDDNPYGTSEAPNEIKVKLLGDDGATIIEEVQGTEEVQDAPIYDLSGRRIMKDKLDKGIYIINGKKVLVR